MGKTSTDARDAVNDLLYSIKGIFGRYSRSARKEGWAGVQSPKGRTIINKLLNNPDAPLIGLSRLVDFKKWIAHKVDNNDS